MAQQSRQARRWRDLAPIGGMSGVALIGPPIGGLVILGTLPTVGPWLASHGWLGVAIYLIGFIVCAGLAILPTYAQAALGGWAFGFGWGMAAALVGFAGGALLAYGLGRPIAGRRLIDRIEASERWRAVHDALIKSSPLRATLIVTLIRVPPTSPFALTNVLLTSAHVPWGPYVVGTVIGLSPRTAAAVMTAAGIAQLETDKLATSPSNWNIIFAIISTLVVILVLSLMARRALRRVLSAEPAGSEMQAQSPDALT